MSLTELAVWGILGPATVYYTRYLWLSGRAFRRLQAHHDGEPGLQLSVVVAARNEAHRITACLNSLQTQSLATSAFEVLLVDDHSTDATAGVVTAWRENHPQFPVRLLALPEGKAGKKAALAHGIAAARFPVILTTDADTTASTTWLATMAAAFSPATVAVAGPIGLAPVQGGVESFQALESAGLVALAAGDIARKAPTLANGANFAFRRSAFEYVGGYSDIAHVASGDDELLLHKLAKAFPTGIRFQKARTATVFTAPESTFQGLWRQRIRWVSKGRAYRNPPMQRARVAAFMTCLGLLVASPLAMQGVVPWEILLGTWLLKATAEFTVLYPATRFLGNTTLLWGMVAHQVVHPLYVVAVGSWGTLTRTYAWKERRVR